MSQIREFKRIATAHGKASIRDHVKNYFDKTGRVADEVGIKSLMARVNKALRTGGDLHELAGVVIMPSETSRGRQAEWTLGHETVDDVLGDLMPQDSKELAPVLELLNDEQKPAFLMTSTQSHLMTAIARAAKGSRIAQRELGGGFMAEEYERRLRAMNEESERREKQQKDEIIADQRRVIDYLTQGGVPQRGNGRAVVTTRRGGREDAPALRDEVN